MNDFDFYVIKAYSNSIRSLMKLGVERNSIKTQIYYRGRYPVKEHSVSLATVDVMNIGHAEASKIADNIAGGYNRREGIPADVKIHVKFFPVD